MTRTDSDTWDLASSVGATATMVATARALATKEAEPLINDPYADPLVRAVGVEFFINLLDGQIDLTGEVGTAAAMMTNLMAVRTKFFDDFFTSATAAGIRQAVILAAGLDSRAYRLDWPAGTVVYEIDQPEVIAAKTGTMAQIGATPTCERRTVAIDLREDWPAALRAAGFDSSAPTAWLAEGLLIYLPPEAQDKLFDNIHELSAPGSAVATEFVPGLKDFDADKAREAAAGFAQLGLNLDMPSLVYHGERHSAADYLAAKGWQTTGVGRSDLHTRYGLAAADLGGDDPMREIIYISGTLG